MGIRGLTTFIAHDSKRYLKPIKLKDSFLVIDGNCVACHLYKWCTKRDSAFGGDYDEYYVVVNKFFATLKKCKITPIVVFDGGYEDKKIKTVLDRLKDKLMTLKTTFAKGFSSTKFFPLFMKDVFVEAAYSFGVTIIQCELEADGVIADLAKQLDCPVLSYDSDFFVFDVAYIPFSTVEIDFSNVAYHIDGLPCSIYELDNFFNEYPGLKREHLPIICTLLGNDFVPSHVFFNFFKQIPLARLKNSSNSSKRILGLLNWLKHESEASAIRKIQSFIGKTNFELFENGLKLSKKSYELNSGYEVDSSGKIVKQAPFSLKLDKKIINLLATCRLPSMIINLKILRCYFLPLQVEDINASSSHEVALLLIKIIDKLICSPTGEEQDLSVYLREGKFIKRKTIMSNNSNENEELNLSVALHMAAESRMEIIFENLKIDAADRDFVKSAPRECQLFLSSFIFWTKLAKPSINHMHSLLFGFLGCQAKSKMGLFRAGQSWSIKTDQLANFAAILRPFRKTTQQGKTKFNCTIVHPFSQFQSILYHCSIINVLLGSPFSPCRVGDSFNGTLIFNLYLKFEPESNNLTSVQNLLNSCHCIYELYESYCDKLARYFTVAPSTSTHKRKRKKKNVQCSDGQQETLKENPEDSSHIYTDVTNQFYALNI